MLNLDKHNVLTSSGAAEVSLVLDIRASNDGNDLATSVNISIPFRGISFQPRPPSSPILRKAVMHA